MSVQHRYALANSPGRVLTTAGAICLTAALVAAAVLGLGASLYSGFGAFDLLAPISKTDAGLHALSVFVLLAYPSLYALSLLSQVWSFGGAPARWLGRRVRGSLCLLWSTLLAGLFFLHAIQAPALNAGLAVAATALTVGGLAVRSIERQSHASWQPLARMMPAALLSAIAVGTALFAWLDGVRLDSLRGLLASAVLVGTTLLLAGSTRDVLHQLRRAPRRFFCRKRMQSALHVN